MRTVDVARCEAGGAVLLEERKLVIAELVRNAGGCRDAVAFPVKGHVLVAVEICRERVCTDLSCKRLEAHS